MNDEQLNRFIDLLVTGDISPAEHEELQSILKTDAKVRAAFCHRMDLESGLRNWAAESAGVSAGSFNLSTLDGDTRDESWNKRQPALLVALVASLVFFVAALSWFPKNKELPIVDSGVSTSAGGSSTEQGLLPSSGLGQLIEQPDCQWQVKPVSWSGTFDTGTAVLQQGAAELRFGSGTNLILQAPCELKVTDASTAELLAGSVALHVTELSNGFVLETPESVILDEGTEYAVSVTPDSTEVHVFDGSVWWVPKLEDERETEQLHDRIEAGQAKQYARLKPSDGKFIPFGRRQFVWSIEQSVRRNAEGEIIAYDAFENLAGRIRRGRSGFGWAGGWLPSGQRRGSGAEIVDASAGVVFGVNREHRRLMMCKGGADLRRELSPSFTWGEETELYLSFIVRYEATDTQPAPKSEELEDKTPVRLGRESDRSLRMTLEPDLPGRGRTRHAVASFGITSTGVPFLNSRHRVSRAGLSIVPSEDYFCVVQLPSAKSNLPPRLRVYHSSEAIELGTAETWTVEADLPVERKAIRWIRVATGRDAVWQIDELRLGSTWQSVIAAELNAD